MKKNNTPTIKSGIANIEILIFVKPTISQELAVFPKFTPKIIPMPAPKEISPALKKEIEYIETKVEDCIIKVLKVPKSILFIFVSVDFAKIFSSKPPQKA